MVNILLYLLTMYLIGILIGTIKAGYDLDQDVKEYGLRLDREMKREAVLGCMIIGVVWPIVLGNWVNRKVRGLP